MAMARSCLLCASTSRALLGSSDGITAHRARTAVPSVHAAEAAGLTAEATAETDAEAPDTLLCAAGCELVSVCRTGGTAAAALVLDGCCREPSNIGAAGSSRRGGARLTGLRKVVSTVAADTAAAADAGRFSGRARSGAGAGRFLRLAPAGGGAAAADEAVCVDGNSTMLE